jgi:hypothetical protein
VFLENKESVKRVSSIGSKPGEKGQQPGCARPNLMTALHSAEDFRFVEIASPPGAVRIC